MGIWDARSALAPFRLPGFGPKRTPIFGIVPGGRGQPFHQSPTANFILPTLKTTPLSQSSFECFLSEDEIFETTTSDAGDDRTPRSKPAFETETETRFVVAESVDA